MVRASLEGPIHAMKPHEWTTRRFTRSYADGMISLGLSSSEKSGCSEPPVAALRALGETAAWCTRHPLRPEGLRSSALDPRSILSVPVFNELGIDAFVKVTRDSYQQATESINRRRSELLRDAATQPVEPADAQMRGRLLLYEAMETVSDGAAEASSHGFFDIEDAPPWDTWFWHREGTIFCWVPESLVSSAQAGIGENPVDCIHWANWSALISR